MDNIEMRKDIERMFDNMKTDTYAFCDEYYCHESDLIFCLSLMLYVKIIDGEICIALNRQESQRVPGNEESDVITNKTTTGRSVSSLINDFCQLVEHFNRRKELAMHNHRLVLKQYITLPRKRDIEHRCFVYGSEDCSHKVRCFLDLFICIDVNKKGEIVSEFVIKETRKFYVEYKPRGGVMTMFKRDDRSEKVDEHRFVAPRFNFTDAYSKFKELVDKYHKRSVVLSATNQDMLD